MRLKALKNPVYILVLAVGSAALGIMGYFSIWDGTLVSILPMVGAWVVIVGATLWIGQS